MNAEAEFADFDREANGAARKWRELMPPPRVVPGSVRRRLLWQAVSAGVVFSCAFGTLFIVAGAIVLGVGGRKVPWLVGAGLLGVGIALVAAAVAVTFAGRRRKLDVLTWGEVEVGRITQVYDRTYGGFRPYDEVLDEWSRFQAAAGSMQFFSGGIASQLKNWPVKVALQSGRGGDGEEIEIRMDLGRRLTETVRDPHVVLLVDRRGAEFRCLATEDVSWIEPSEFGDVDVSRAEAEKSGELVRSVGRAALVVVPTYALAAVGVKFGADPPVGGAEGADMPAIFGVFVVLLFTLTHGVVPVFFYYLFVGGLNSADSKGPGHYAGLLLARGFIALHMGVWYGIPIAALAYQTGWYSVLWIVIHVVTAGRGRRQWAFLEHGSTSLALLLFLLCFSKVDFFPSGIFVVLMQSLLLTIVEWKGKSLWLGDAAATDAANSENA